MTMQPIHLIQLFFKKVINKQYVLSKYIFYEIVTAEIYSWMEYCFILKLLLVYNIGPIVKHIAHTCRNSCFEI